MSAVIRRQNKKHNAYTSTLCTNQVIAIMVTAPHTAHETAMLVIHKDSAVLRCRKMPRVAAALKSPVC